jgi:hypothetical protein
MEILNSILFSSIIAIAVVFGMVYVNKYKWMRYHEKAVGVTWANLSKELRILIRSFMIIIGFSWCSIAIITVCFYHLTKDIPISIIPIFLMNIGTFIGSFKLKFDTRGNPPVWLSLLLFIIMIFLVLNF